MIKKMILIIVIVLILALAIGYRMVGNYFYNISLNPQTDKTFVLGEVVEKTPEEQAISDEMLGWLKENSEDVYLTSTNNGNLKLHAYEISSERPSDIWTIVIHGYMDEGSGMTSFARQFYKMGHNVLVVDLRGHGLSEGDYVGMGWHDRLDVIDWIHYIIEKNEKSQIILFGVSMGAATTMMTTGEELPSNVKLAISDCGYSSVWDEFKYQLNFLFDLPEFPVLYAADSSCKRIADYSFREASCVEQVKKSKTPTLFIHGNLDRFVPYEMLDSVYEAAACEKEKLVIDGAAHTLASTVNPSLYWETVRNFIGQHLDEYVGLKN